MGGAVIETTGGSVRGRAQGPVQVFRGLPFAAPPVGELRFRSPRPVAPWGGVREASEPGPSSWQVLSAGSAWIYENDGSPSEDCLSLNVWTPGLSGSRPVMVWFHGGAFRTGHGALPIFDGQRLAEDGDVVVVTCNYRLGGLGWLAHPELRDPETGAWANWGLQDQAAALRWVQANIAAFGGDPTNVTIFGESAGAMSVAHLARHPANAGLCHRLIAQSPARRFGAAAAPDQAAEYTEAVAAALGTTVDGLRGVAVERLFAAELELGRDPGWAARRLGATPVLDGQVVPAADAATLPALPLLVGSNRDESAMWLSLFTPEGERVSLGLPPADEPALRRAVPQLLATSLPGTDLDAATVIDAYQAEFPNLDAAGRFLNIFTDATFRAPVAAWAAAQTAHGHAAYVYEFAHPSPIPGVGAAHTLEIPFVFGTFEQPFLAARSGAGPREAALSALMRRLWTTFARTGNPNLPDLPEWPRYDADSRRVALLGGPGAPRQLVEAPRERTRAVWDAALA